MTCLGTKLTYITPNLNPILRQFVKHASNATNFQPLFSTEGPRNHNFYRYQTERYSTCRRIDPCIERKKELKDRKERKAKEKEKSFWGSLFEKKRKPRYETCRLEAQKRQWEEEPIPEFIKEMCKDLPAGAAIYRTKGNAFILEVPCKEPKKIKKTRAEVQLSKIERDKQCITLEDEKNPMPYYTNPGKLFLELQSRKLHPLYKKLEMPRSCPISPFKLNKYGCVVGDKNRTKLSQTFIYKRCKTCFADFKMGVLPRYLEVREKEYRINKNSAMDRRREKINACDFRFSPITKCPKLDCPRWLNQNPRK